MAKLTSKNKNSVNDDLNQNEVSEGKILDYITGQWVKETEQEKVRQNFERTLVEEYNYSIPEIQVDLKIKVWDGDKQKVKKIPLAVIHEETKDPLILIIIANTKANPTDKTGGASELEQCLIDVQTAEFGCWTNGIETIFFQKKKSKFDLLHLTTLWHINRNLKKIIDGFAKVLVSENNGTSQMTTLLKSQFDFNPDRIFTKNDGRPFFPEEIIKILSKK